MSLGLTWILPSLTSCSFFFCSSSSSSLSNTSSNMSCAFRDPSYTVLWTVCFCWARFTIRSSIVPFVTRRYTYTSSLRPMRCARSVAWASMVGFQSLSQKMTTSAAVRVTPRPPALVERRKAKTLGLFWYSWTMSLRSEMLAEPSSRRYWQFMLSMQSSRMSSILVIWQNISTRWPRAFFSFSSLSRYFIFALSPIMLDTCTISTGVSDSRTYSTRVPFAIARRPYSCPTTAELQPCHQSTWVMNDRRSTQGRIGGATTVGMYIRGTCCYSSSTRLPLSPTKRVPPLQRCTLQSACIRQIGVRPLKRKQSMMVAGSPKCLSRESSLGQSSRTAWVLGRWGGGRESQRSRGRGKWTALWRLRWRWRGWPGGTSSRVRGWGRAQRKGVRWTLRSKSSGWLQTLRNCMTRFMRLSTLALDSVMRKRSLRESFCLIISQSLCWRAVISHSTWYSIFLPISCSTSFFTRRSMNGFRILCSRCTWCSFSFFWSCECASMSFENHSWNCSCESNSFGIMKCSRAHSSAIVFWMGVPVSSSLFREWNPIRVFQRWEVTFLMACASSSTMYCHFSRWKAFSSATISWQDVTTTWNCESRRPVKRLLEKNLRMVLRSLMLPQQGSTFREGQNFSISCFQLKRVELGATTRKGPQKPFSPMCAMRAMAWMVLPSPISSAKMPLMPCSYRLSSHRRPLSWYSLSEPLKDSGGFTRQFTSSTLLRSSLPCWYSLRSCWFCWCICCTFISTRSLSTSPACSSCSSRTCSSVTSFLPPSSPSFFDMKCAYRSLCFIKNYSRFLCRLLSRTSSSRFFSSASSRSFFFFMSISYFSRFRQYTTTSLYSFLPRSTWSLWIRWLLLYRLNTSLTASEASRLASISRSDLPLCILRAVLRASAIAASKPGPASLQVQWCSGSSEQAWEYSSSSQSTDWRLASASPPDRNLKSRGGHLRGSAWSMHFSAQTPYFCRDRCSFLTLFESLSRMGSLGMSPVRVTSALVSSSLSLCSSLPPAEVAAFPSKKVLASQYFADRARGRAGSLASSRLEASSILSFGRKVTSDYRQDIACSSAVVSSLGCCIWGRRRSAEKSCRNQASSLAFRARGLSSLSRLRGDASTVRQPWVSAMLKDQFPAYPLVRPARHLHHKFEQSSFAE